ncbi:MAG: hypothetical protein V7749_00860 [Cocleimonas sp.]
MKDFVEMWSPTGAFLGAITIIGICITAWYRIKRVEEGKITNKIAIETLTNTVMPNRPSITLVADVTKLNLPLDCSSSFCINVVATNAGERNVVFEKVRVRGEYQKHDGKFQANLGVHSIFKNNKPVVKPAESVKGSITITCGYMVEPRLKLILEADVRVGNYAIETFKTDYQTEWLY